jgi:dTMP kinase
MAPGKFITFEGGEGAGKSTQAKLLAGRLGGRGIGAVLTREPGGSPFAEQVRGLILDPAIAPHSPLAEALLFYAARTDHLDKTIRPALESGRWVICDRFSDSTRVYQCEAGGLALATLEVLEAQVVGPTVPDLTFILDVEPQVGLARAAMRRLALARNGEGTDAFEKRALAFHERLRAGYLAIAKAAPERCVVVDAAAPRETLAGEIWGHVERRLPHGVP